MDYTQLAIQLIDMRASAPQIKMERTMSKIARGEVLALNYLAANGNQAYPKDMSRALMLTTARVAAMLKSLEGQGMVTRTCGQPAGHCNPDGKRRCSGGGTPDWDDSLGSENAGGAGGAGRESLHPYSGQADRAGRYLAVIFQKQNMQAP